MVGAGARAGTPRTIVAIGEALWDVFPDKRRPGGAPCNVAYHAARLGDRGAIVTRVGRDAAGDELVAFLAGAGVDTGGVQRDDARPTGTVRVTAAAHEPQYTITEDVAWDYLTADDAARALVGAADAVCVGSLAQRHPAGRAAIHALLQAARGRALVVFDVNLRPPFGDAAAIEATCRMAEVVKLSDQEVRAVSALLGKRALVRWLLDDVGVRAVCVTRGADGAAITTRDGTVSAAGLAINGAAGDAVGAGDAFTAAMIHQLVRGAAPERTVRVANRYAALVATRSGAMPPISAEEVAWALTPAPPPRTARDGAPP